MRANVYSPLRAAVLIVVTLLLQAAAGGPAEAAEATGLTTKRIVITDSAGNLADTFRETADGATPATWERQKPGGSWSGVKVLDRTEHVVWFYDAAGREEVRVEFPGLGIRTRPASLSFPNTNPWTPSRGSATAYLTRGADPTEAVTGLTVERFELRDGTGVVIGRYRVRVPGTNPPTWEAQDAGGVWRSPIRVVDRSEHLVWLYDGADDAELRVEFPGLVAKSRPGSKVFPNPAPWTQLPLRVSAFNTHGGAATPGPTGRVTFHVQNRYGARVELFQPAQWPPTSEGALVDVIPDGQSRTYTADTNLGWVLRRTDGGKAEIQRFKISQEDQRIVVLPARAPPPPTPPTPQPVRTETLSLTAAVVRFGGWAHISGDPDMDTDGSDRVPVQVKSRLSYSADGVYVDVYFRCQEYRGDGTAYGGHWDTVELFTKNNGKIPRDARVVGLRPRGGATEREWSVVSIGKQHNLQSLLTRGTYWDDLAFRVDHRKRGDGAHVGIRGTITLEVVVER